MALLCISLTFGFLFNTIWNKLHLWNLVKQDLLEILMVFNAYVLSHCDILWCIWTAVFEPTTNTFQDIFICTCLQTLEVLILWASKSLSNVIHTRGSKYNRSKSLISNLGGKNIFPKHNIQHLRVTLYKTGMVYAVWAASLENLTTEVKC